MTDQPERVQTYRHIRTFEHMSKRRGRLVTLHEWEADCVDCGLPFRAITKAAFRLPLRRCDNCKARGVKTGVRAVPLWPEGAGEGGKDADPSP